MNHTLRKECEQPHHEKYADVTLQKDEYYSLGDNRANSRDSRDIGPVARSEIEGKLILRFYPFSKFGVYRSEFEGKLS